jgi:hypothetical protein
MDTPAPLRLAESHCRHFGGIEMSFRPISGPVDAPTCALSAGRCAPAFGAEIHHNQS